MARANVAEARPDPAGPGEPQPGEVPEATPGETGPQAPSEPGEEQPEGAVAMLARAERERFSALKLDMSARKVFAGSVTTYPQEVIDFVESLYEAFNVDPDWWYRITLDTPEDVDVALEKARAYGRERAKGRLTINCRREPDDPKTAWFRASGYTKGKRG